MVAIPLLPVPAQQVRAVLDGQACTLRLRQHGTRLYLDLDLGETALLRGRVCLDRAAFPLPPAFAGTLFFADLNGAQDPDYTGLGGRHLLLYAAAGEAAPSWTQTV